MRANRLPHAVQLFRPGCVVAVAQGGNAFRINDILAGREAGVDGVILTAVVAANGRAQALTEAERAAAVEQGREQRRRFLTPGTGYQPGHAQMFNNGNN